MDARVLESHKENIQPRATGRPALKLGAALATPRASLDTERARLEKALTADDWDDPLQAYLDYLEWTHCHFPQGNNAESGLLALLERCTLFFRDTPYYKDDPRYLKVWLEYAAYLDLPRDIFVYLAKKDIGRALALYYEEFARFLEANGAAADARQVLEVGLERAARPVARLRRSLAQFCARSGAAVAPARTAASVRAVFAASPHSAAGSSPRLDPQAARAAPALPGVSAGLSPPTKRARLHVFSDAARPSLRDTVFAADPNPQLHPVALRTKENTISAQPWAGQVLPQKSDRAQSPAHFEVFRDPHETKPPAPAPTPDFEVAPENGHYYTLVHHPGKPTEKLSINLALVYPSPDEEYSFAEILALSRKFASPPLASPLLPSPPSPANATFTIPLRDDTMADRPPSPTITMVSRAATNEVLSMFNSAAQNLNLDDNVANNEDESTNFDGFVTETLVQPTKEPETPPTDHYDSDVLHAAENSSPFLETPLLRLIDPLSTSLRRDLLSRARVESLAGYHKYPRATAKFSTLLSLASDSSKAIPKGNPHSLITFCGREIFSLRYELGRGGFGVVFLSENETGDLKAVKTESPASSWEFYILKTLHSRLPQRLRHQIVHPEALYQFDDESYLVLNYVSQGTILDVVNMYANQNRVVDEMVTIYLTTVLLRLVENLHNAGIIHGDLKADNCMINFEDAGVLSERFTPHDPTWNKKSLVLIDFGRAIDLNLFDAPNKVQFVSKWETDDQDCPQMANGEPWRFEADYFGIAAIVHTMLFGRYIETRLDNGKYVLRSQMKRYWQCELWAPLFDLLLNPYYGESSNVMPISEKLRSVRQGFEQWLGSPAQSRKLRADIIKIERELEDKHHKIMRLIR